ncbi:hypothetical protein K1T71_014147 [Dendrolimus kikuchii]|uniref:Uncharacterized protein n=1 Tax=Dendrolimus kikuchii TaxID=765133 RepID=A0ACC1CF58_9NEOP|nr:hypothetical protein K1T71_014147 [Dendrolimus kikuchii]
MQTSTPIQNNNKMLAITNTPIALYKGPRLRLLRAPQQTPARLRVDGESTICASYKRTYSAPKLQPRSSCMKRTREVSTLH